MNEKFKNIYLVSFLAVIFFGLSLFAILKAPDEYSLAERRKLEQFPEINSESLLGGRFMEDFEDYTLDQFPLRDAFRSLKAFTSLKVMNQSDSNGYYIHEGNVAALEYPMKGDSIDWAGKVFKSVYDRFLAGKDMNVYFAVVPDKNYFLAEDAGVLHMDYDEFYSRMYAATDYMTHIELRDKLALSDYYLTDTHWRQECIVDVAETIAEAMGVSLPTEYEQVLVNAPFKGVYFSQLGLSVDTEELFYLTNDTIGAFKVFDMQNNKEMPVYNTALANSKDPYEMFLSGALSLITIENPNAATDRELIIFRDSFGSAISPLLAQGYAKVTMVDIRYIQPAFLQNFVSFENQDVLFLYSTLVLNNSSTLKP